VPTYDVVVAGLGGFGSSAAYHLARRGLQVLGLDPRPAHDEVDDSDAIVRQVYRGAAYVPPLRRTYELWAGLSHDDGAPVLRTTGGLFARLARDPG
jgi:sarcosine oxidase